MWSEVREVSDSDVLSQEEINELVQALLSGQISPEQVKEKEEEKKIKPYDFKRPSKFSKEQMRTFQMIHENFARSLSTFLSGRLRSFVDVTLSSVDQITYEEFIKSLLNPSFIVVFSGDNLEGNAVFEMGLDIFYTMLDMIMGGPGEKPLNRSPTDIEISVMRREIMNMLTILAQAWSDIQSFIPTIENIESNPQFVQIVPPNEMVLLITVAVSIGETSSFINICWPSSLLEPFSDKLSARYWFAAAKKEEARKKEEIEKLEKSIRNVMIDLVAILGETTLSLKDILELEVGDVIRLNTHFDEEISIAVDGVEKFKGIPGRHKGNYAVRITKVTGEVIESE